MKRLNTETWLKRQGLSAQYFALIPLALARAIKAATHIQKQYATRLNAVQREEVGEFLLTTKSHAGRAGVTPAQCYQILNLASKLNRQHFRHQKRQRKGTSG